MKVSIIIAVLNSHKVVIRQLRHFKHMPLPKDTELILMDDGSEPPITFNVGMDNISLHYTNDKRPWTQGLARNKGAKIARGEFLFFTDIDHIITKEALDAVRRFDGDKMVFRRYFGIFDRQGNILSDRNTILAFGLDPIRYKRRRLSAGVHGNTYAIRKTIFEMMGGYDRKYCESRFHVGGQFMSEERDFNRRWARLSDAGKVKEQVMGPRIYCYPVSKFRADGDNNPGGLFHSLSLEQVPQPMLP